MQEALLRPGWRALFSGQCLILMLSTSSFGFTQQLTDRGFPIQWKGAVHFQLVGNPTSASGFSSGSFYNAIVRGLQRWKSASNQIVNFDYWQGDSSEYFANNAYNGQSSIYFTSRTNESLSSNVIAVTQVWYDTDTGQILETDIALNDRNYQFTSNPRDTTGGGSGAPSSGFEKRVFIENIVTHELGHALGLAHSGNLQASMLAIEAPEQAKLSCDDQAAISTVYPGVSASSKGQITGRVESSVDGRPVLGAQVVAISRRRGTVLATALVDQTGSYFLRGLEEGDYYLMVEPYYVGPSALSTYYASMNHRFCSQGEYFSRSFALENDGYTPEAIYVGASQSVSGPTLVAQCTGNGAAAGLIPGSFSLGAAPVIHDGGFGGFGAVGRFSGVSKVYLKLNNVSGRIEVSLLGYSLFSPVHPKIELLDQQGQVIASPRYDFNFEGESGYRNFDSTLVVNDLEPGDYYLKISRSSMSSIFFPGSPEMLDASPFFVLTGSVNEPMPPLANEYKTNSRCSMDENFGAYQSPAGAPPSGFDDGGIGFCGTVAMVAADQFTGRRPPPGGLGGTPLQSVVGWMVPWVLMFMGLSAVRFQWLARMRQSR